MAGILTAAVASTFSGVTPDPYFEYTTLLLPGSGTNGAQNNSFVDSSANAFPITRNPLTGPNAPTQGTFSPFSQTGWGNFNPDSSNGIGVATNTALNMGTGDFTVEAWVNTAKLPTTNAFQTTSGGYQAVFGTGPNSSSTGSQLYIGVTNLFFDIAVDGGGPINVAHNMVAGQWYHVAISRSGTTFRAFINGVLVQTATSSASWVDGYAYGIMRAEPIGGFNGAWWYGYVSNFRLTKGGALYTANFTPSVTPLTTTVSAGTVSLLTCQSNRFIDNSTNNFTITVNGDTRVVAFSPFNPTASWSAATYGGSGYFDGSGDYLTVASNSTFAFGTGDFAIAFWIYPTQAFLATGSAPVSMAYNTGFNISIDNVELSFWIAGTRIQSSTRPTPNQWNYVVCTRQSGTAYVYINGTQTATGSLTGSVTNSQIYIGTASHNVSAETVVGYLSGIRILNTNLASTVPTSPPTSDANTKLLLNFTNAGIYDATSKNDLETVDGAQISNTTAKFGSTSIKFDGTGDYLIAKSQPFLNPGSSNFTIEAWVNFSAAVSSTLYVIVAKAQNTGTNVSSYTFFRNTSNKLALAFWSDGTGSNYANISTTANFPSSTGVWNHVAVTRSGSTFYLFIDGVSQTITTSLNGTATLSSPIFASETPITVGSTADQIGFFNGYVQDVRITNYARYTSNFTPPTAAFPTL